MKRTFTCVRKTLLALSITTISLIFATSCFMGGSGGIPEAEPIIPGEHTSTEIKNVILNVDLDNNNTHRFTEFNAIKTTDKLFDKWDNPSRPNDALIDRHKKVYKLEGNPNYLKSNGGNFIGSFIRTNVLIREASSITFNFKSDMYYDKSLDFAIYEKDYLGNEKCIKKYDIGHKGHGEGWRKVSISLPIGEYIISIELPRLNGYSPNLSNCIYIDNITIAPDNVEYIDIYPKGIQETYVNGDKIQFTAVPLRGDRSVIENKRINYFVSGCGTIDSNGLFVPTAEGVVKLTVTIDGKRKVKENIIVHKESYLSDKVNIGKYTFTGNITDDNMKSFDTNNIRFDYSETPQATSFGADGFFILKGYTDVPFFINVSKNQSKYDTSYLVRSKGFFYKRIWLRFGKGDYEISIIEDPKMEFFNTQDEKYEGEISSASGLPVKILKVQNTNHITESEAIYLLPSEFVQSDDFALSNVAHSIAADLPSSASEADALRSIHDYVIHNLFYDNVSAKHNERRKRQDALHTARYGMGVCEGYSNLYAALARSLGIKTKVIGESSLNHAWNQVYYKDNWYLVDTTWDDPIPFNAGDGYYENSSNNENYRYFMTALTDEKHIYQGVPTVDNRSITNIKTISTIKGMPEGWY